MNEEEGKPMSMWLGGGTGSGKSTIARTIAHRFDIALYRVDARAYAHRARLAGRGLVDDRPQSYDERWLAPQADKLAREFIDGSAKVMDCVLEDLQASDDQVITLVEGPQLLPSLVAPHLRDVQCGIWLIPSSSFRRRALQARATDSAKFTSDADRALRKRLERDEIIDGQVRDEAHDAGLTVVEVDGSDDLPAMAARVTDHFRPVIDAGPRLTDGAHRQRLRQVENLVMWQNASAFLDDLGADAPPDPPPISVACECANLGCDALAELTPAEYGRAVEHGSVTESSECVGRLR